MSGTFEALVLVGLVVLIAVVIALAVFVMKRQPAMQAGGPGLVKGPADGTVATSAATAMAEPSAVAQREAQLAETEAKIFARREAAESEILELQSRAEDLMRTAQASRAESEAEAATRRNELREQRSDLERREQRLADREERLDAEARALDDRAHQLDDLKADLKRQRRELADAESEQLAVLERVAGLTAEQAKAELVAAVEHEAKRQAVLVARDIERQAAREAETKAQAIVVDAIQRVASEQTSESVVSAVHLPGDEMKGRIIGREGRNIRAFEQVTGVNVMIGRRASGCRGELGRFRTRRAESCRLIWSLITDRTRVVAVTAASNLLGTRPDVAAMAATAHAAGALLYVDGVHYAAHALVDLAARHLPRLLAVQVLRLLRHCLCIRPSWCHRASGQAAAVDRYGAERFELGTLPYEILAGTTVAIDFIADWSTAAVPSCGLARSLAASEDHHMSHLASDRSPRTWRCGLPRRRRAGQNLDAAVHLRSSCARGGTAAGRARGQRACRQLLRRRGVAALRTRGLGERCASDCGVQLRGRRTPPAARRGQHRRLAAGGEPAQEAS